MELITVGKIVLKKLIEHHDEAYFVGGMVRDQLLGREIYDVDITTSAKPEVVTALFEKTIATGIKHGTVTVMIKNIPIEVTTFRIESGYQDYRRPSEVLFTTSLDEDLKRRDFTMNAIAQSIDGTLYDPFNGLQDLKNQTIRAVGDPLERFTEDPLRMLRGLRFVSKLGFTLDPKTYEGINCRAELIQHISKERVKKELEGLMKGEQSAKGLSLLVESGLIDYIDYFQPLKPYQNYPLELIQSSLELYGLIGILNKESIQEYLAAWPFSREEKRQIKGIYESYQQQWPLPYIQYKYGEMVARAYHQLNCFFKQQEEPFQEIELSIQNKKELEIEVSTLLKEINRPKGPWIQKVIERLEYEVIMKQLENEESVLIQYIKTNHLGELYECEK